MRARTRWNADELGTRAHKETPQLLPDYEPSVAAVVKALKSYWGHETSDPAKVAQVILRLAASDRLPAHLLLGSDAVKYTGEAEAARAADAERCESLASRQISMLRALYQLCDSERDPGSEHESHCATAVRRSSRLPVGSALKNLPREGKLHG